MRMVYPLCFIYRKYIQVFNFWRALCFMIIIDSNGFWKQNNFLDEWNNFLERIGVEKSDDSLISIKEHMDAVREWVSYRGQTLSRTGLFHTLCMFFCKSSIYFLVSPFFFYISVRGMMYYRQALELQCFLDMGEDQGTHNLLSDVDIVL